MRRARGLLPALALFQAVACGGASDPSQAVATAEATASSDGPQPTSTPIAVVGGETLYAENLDGAAAFRIYRHEVDIYSLLLSEAERRIERRLLEAEARRRDTDVEALLAEVEGSAEEVDEAAIDRYLAEHPREAARARDADVRARVRHYLGERGRIARRIAFLGALRERAGVEILLQPPLPPRTDIDIEGAPVRGPDPAAVTLVHFATFSSRSSARSAAAVQRILERYPDRVRHVHRAFLNDRDEPGLLAARIAAVAQERGLFWPLHDRLFAEQGHLDAEKIVEAARAVGLDDAAIERARLDAGVLERVKRDIQAANASGAIREPTLFVNGLFVSPLDPKADLESLVLEELDATRGP